MAVAITAVPGSTAGADAARTLLLPLRLLTFTTGLIDAVSFLGLGHVFTANMTGNVVFIGFALAGVEGMSLTRSVLALAAFAAGAAAGGVVIRSEQAQRAGLLARAAAAEALLVGGSAALALGAPLPDDRTVLALIASTGVAMGLRNAVVRALAVPDMTTTVLTLTITGLAADAAAGLPAHTGRRATSVGLMLGGAALGAVALTRIGSAAALAIAAVVAALAAGLAWRRARAGERVGRPL